MAVQNTNTTSDLVSLIKILGHVPQSNATFTPANLLTLADSELRTAIAKMLKVADEGYFQTIVENNYVSSGIYSMPSAAVASAAYVIQIRNGVAIWPVSRQDVAEMTTTNGPSGGNWSFFIRNNKLHLLPAEFSGVLRITYERRPSKLVPVSSCAQVSSIAGQVITVASVPSGWIVGYTLDLQSAQPPFDVLSTCTITNISGTAITLSGTVTDLAVSDFLCLEEQTCVPQIPIELQQLLAQLVVCRIYELQGYLDKLKVAKDKANEMKADLTAIITPRVQSTPKVINPAWGGRQIGNRRGRFIPPAGA